MKKYNLLLIIVFLSFTAWAQPVVFNLSNKASFSIGSSDTFDYPFTGGLNSPQFSKIDFNGDGVKDLFVFDRVGNKVLTYVFKNGKYAYEPKYESEFPKLYYWALLRDYDKDGKEDIFTEIDFNARPEADKYVYGNGLRVIKNVSTDIYKKKWLQSKNQLYDLGIIDLPPSILGILNSDINAIEDMDGDGDLDILQMPPSKNVITYYQNMSKERGFGLDSLLFQFRDECWGYMSYKVNYNSFVLNDNSACFRNYKGILHDGGTALTPFDADNDGDMDLLYGDKSFQNLVFLKNGKTINKQGRDSIIQQDTIYPKNTLEAKVDIFPAAYILDVDNDGKRDMLVAPAAQTAAKSSFQISYYKNTGSNSVPIFAYQNNTFLQDETLDLGSGNAPQFVDIDSDGDQDLVMATHGDYAVTQNSNDRLLLFMNMGTASKAKYLLMDNDFLTINSSNPKTYMIAPCFGDLNGDGKPDMLMGDMNGKFHYFENTSRNGNISFKKISSNYFSMFAGVFNYPQLVDLNKDGLLDIVTGRKNGTLAYFENSGADTLPNFTASPTIDSIGKIDMTDFANFGFAGAYSMPHVCDLDKDGFYEILVGCDYGRVSLFSNFEASATRVCPKIENVFSEGLGIAPSNVEFGPACVVSSADIDADGLSEILIGNYRGGIRMYTTDVKGIISGLPKMKSNPIQLQIYPNPAKDILVLKSDANLKDQAYVIFDVLGNVILSGELNSYESSIDVQRLKNGLYILQTNNPSGSKLLAKIVIEK
ncbi:MAG: hypothetical protein CFE21_15470 [Bacteroidetes bacterium B1(2017)]|nr:MAG: hypothetical protein CFE21_15470 [Bacteroidetes bacterium B1(2017)]